MDYKYGITILTNTKIDVKGLELEDGIYYAVKFPKSIKQDKALAKKWLGWFLENSLSSLTRTLWDKR